MKKIYEFQCIKCETKFEKEIEYSKIKNVACSKCGGKTRKIISSAPTVKFMGKGFYINDSKGKKHG